MWVFALYIVSFCHTCYRLPFYSSLSLKNPDKYLLHIFYNDHSFICTSMNEWMNESMNEYDLSDAITETVAGALNKIKL